MGLDYTTGCVNFRDVGEWVNLLAGADLLPIGRLFRGGKLDWVGSPAEIGSPATIVNVRKGPDRVDLAPRMLHFPAQDVIDNYRTERREVRRWLDDVLEVFEDAGTRYPVMVHCTSGKDRTGIVIAAILRVLDVPPEVIVEEYLASDGDPSQDKIRTALDGFGEDMARYLDRRDNGLIRAHVLGQERGSFIQSRLRAKG